jgi:hypothetical protein
MALGMYDEALSTYNEIEHRLGADTFNNNYTVILRSRAIAARAQGRIAEAYDYQTRYAALSKMVSDSLHRSEAHDYAARYHAQEQQLEIQEKEAEAERSHIVSLTVALIALLAIAFAIYFFRQKRIVSEKNHALVRMINAMQPKPIDSSAVNDADSELFEHIDTAIRNERLYANVGLQRQDICDRFKMLSILFVHFLLCLACSVTSTICFLHELSRYDISCYMRNRHLIIRQFFFSAFYAGIVIAFENIVSSFTIIV